MTPVARQHLLPPHTHTRHPLWPFWRSLQKGLLPLLLVASAPLLRSLLRVRRKSKPERQAEHRRQTTKPSVSSQWWFVPSCVQCGTHTGCIQNPPRPKMHLFFAQLLIWNKQLQWLPGLFSFSQCQVVPWALRRLKANPDTSVRVLDKEVVRAEAGGW